MKWKRRPIPTKDGEREKADPDVRRPLKKLAMQLTMQ
jgi:hypothetical protein